MGRRTGEGKFQAIQHHAPSRVSAAGAAGRRRLDRTRTRPACRCRIARRGPSCTCRRSARCAAAALTTTGCWTPATSADRKDLVGPDPPASRARSAHAPRSSVAASQDIIELLELDRAGQVGRLAGISLGFRVLAPFRPFELLLAGRREFRRRHVRGGEAVLDALVDRHHRLAGKHPRAEQASAAPAW